MRKPTIRYLLATTTAMAICLAVHRIPYPSPILTDLASDTELETPQFCIVGLLTSWPILTLTFVGGISTFMHVVTSITGLSGIRQWAAAILLPTCSIVGWHAYTGWYSEAQLGSRLNAWDHIQIGLIGFTAGFAFVTFVLELPKIIAESKIDETRTRIKP